MSKSMKGNKPKTEDITCTTGLVDKLAKTYAKKFAKCDSIKIDAKTITDNAIADFKEGYIQGFNQGLKSLDKWISIDELNDYKHIDDSKIFVRFDTGEVVNYNNENWPFALATHFLVME